MVDLLCRRGETAAADELEDFWHELGSRRNFSLLCGYKIDLFDRASQVTLLPQVYRSHSHVLPSLDSEWVEEAVAAALAAVLGEANAQRVYARVARHRSHQQVPTAQLALMWVSAHMPRAADRVLAAARAQYVAAATP